MAHLHCILFNGGLSFPSVKPYPVRVAVGSITAGQVIARVPLRNLVAFAISYRKAEGFAVCKKGRISELEVRPFYCPLYGRGFMYVLLGDGLAPIFLLSDGGG